MTSAAGAATATRAAIGAASEASATLEPERIRDALLAWYAARARALPWRRDRDPYRVWVAEVMLQQTRVDVVIPAYERFLRRFPDLVALAHAEEERVLAAWSGLGYYTRARSLHRAARALIARGERAFPRDADAARALPGVGPYTLAAVLSIAYDLPLAAVDGNVVRVLSRLARLPRPDARGEPHRTLAEDLLDRRRPGDWNQALMELGETVCRPRGPRCDACPVHDACAAYVAGVVERHPPARARRQGERVRVVLTLLHDGAGRLLLERGAFPFLPHLWLPPVQLGPSARGIGRPVGSFRHAILHRRLDIEVYVHRLPSRLLVRRAVSPEHERRIFTRTALRRIGRSSLLTKALRVAGPALAAGRAVIDASLPVAQARGKMTRT